MHFDNTYARLPEEFFQRIEPAPVKSPSLIRLNTDLVKELGLVLPSNSDELAAVFSGNMRLEGMEPVAMAYAGHQFGGFVPQLGDGRAVLLGEVVNAQGQRFDIQLKGSGQTRFSRNGDGRSALGPVIREYVVSEAMHALGIPTTRALAFVTTGEQVFRETRKPGGVFTRVASSLIRVGTFEYCAARERWDAVKTLADYVMDRHYPESKSAPNPYLDMYRRVCEATARLVSKWMAVGFIHGVMNTDNTAIAGETIDYGPCAFLDAYVPDKVFSSIDQFGRYAFNNQPSIAKWNMAALGNCLLPLFDADASKARTLGMEVLEDFDAVFIDHYQEDMSRKVGLNASHGGFQKVQDLLALMDKGRVDYTVAFRLLADDAQAFKELFAAQVDIHSWLEGWQALLDKHGVHSTEATRRMRAANPALIPRNHRVEQAIRAAEDEGDFSLTHRLIDVLKQPFDVQPANEDLMRPPTPSEVVKQTFCGT